jgi:hypothetical protein
VLNSAIYYVLDPVPLAFLHTPLPFIILHSSVDSGVAVPTLVGGMLGSVVVVRVGLVALVGIWVIRLGEEPSASMSSTSWAAVVL